MHRITKEIKLKWMFRNFVLNHLYFKTIAYCWTTVLSTVITERNKQNGMHGRKNKCH